MKSLTNEKFIGSKLPCTHISLKYSCEILIFTFKTENQRRDQKLNNL